MEEKLDLRIRKTYLALTGTLLQMMEEMRFEEIRVSELCDRAMVRKSTFYKHFADKYELLTFTVRQVQAKLNAQLAAETADGDRVDYYTRLIALVFDFLDENEALVQSAIKSNSFPLILSTLSAPIILDIQEKIKQDQLHGEKLPADPDVMAAFFVGGVMEIVFRWEKKGKSLKEAALKAQLRDLLQQFYRSAPDR